MLEMEYVKQCLAQYLVETRKHEMESQQNGGHTASGDLAFKFNCHSRMICDISRYAKTQDAFYKMRDEFERAVREMEQPIETRMLETAPIICDAEAVENFMDSIRKLEHEFHLMDNIVTTPHLIDATTSRDIDSGRYPVYVLGFGVSEDDLTDDERKLWEQSKRWRED